MNDYERAVRASSSARDDLADRLALAMETVRRSSPEPAPLASIATGVAAPATLGLVLWAIERAADAGCERIYFAGRNGRLAFEVYERLPEAVTGGVSGTYIRISRNVVRQASAARDLDRWIDCGHATPTSFLRQHAGRLPLRRLLERATAEPDRHEALVRSIGLDLSRPLPDGADAAWRALFDHPEIRASIAEASATARPILVEWLAQHGVFDHRQVALVDVGWRGQQAAMLDAVVDAEGSTRILHLHLGRNKAETLVADASIERWLIDVDRPLVPNPVALFETLFATTERGLVDLIREGGIVVPVMRHADDPVARSPHIEPLGRLVGEVIAEAAVTSSDRSVDLRDVVAAIVTRFWEQPTVEEARWWSAVPYELDAAGRIIKPLATPVGLGELATVLRSRSLGDRQWGRGAVMASAAAIRVVLDVAQRRGRSTAGRG